MFGFKFLDCASVSDVCPQAEKTKKQKNRKTEKQKNKKQRQTKKEDADGNANVKCLDVTFMYVAACYWYW